MKTFYEKFRDKIDCTDNSVVLFEGEYKQIQHDAEQSGYERGIRDAAEVASKHYHQSISPSDLQTVSQAILSLLTKPKEEQ